MVMSESLVTIGVATGIAIALGVSRFVATLLFQLPAGDPLTLAGAVAIMAIVSAFAGYLPARRASRVDPMVALRYE
jgi:ABC-type antimicrobial peptide transport system permease subunit